MGEYSYKRGANAGREGYDPSPPKHDFIDDLTGVSEEKVESWARDYMQGYQAGSQQRLADEMSRERDE